MESLVYIANGLYLGSYFVRDMLRLRLLTVTAALCLVAYFASRPEPMTTVIAWNVFFVMLNLLQIARLLRQRSRAPQPAPAACVLRARASGPTLPVEQPSPREGGSA